jgi:hypothetical protein
MGSLPGGGGYGGMVQEVKIYVKLFVFLGFLVYICGEL